MVDRETNLTDDFFFLRNYIIRICEFELNFWVQSVRNHDQLNYNYFLMKLNFSLSVWRNILPLIFWEFCLSFETEIDVIELLENTNRLEALVCSR